MRTHVFSEHLRAALRCSLAVFAVLCVGTVAVAAEGEQCFEYRINHATGGGYSSGASKQEACDAFAGYVLSVDHANVGGETLNSAVVGGLGNNTCTVTWSGTRLDNGEAYGPTSSSGGIQQVEIDCPENPCEEMSGLAAMLGYQGEGTPSAPFCSTDDGSGGSGNMCQVIKQGASISTGTGFFGQVQFTGEMCDGTEEANDGPNSPNCATGPGGQVCLSRDKKNCGTFNGEAVCLDDVPQGSCALLSDGGAICASDAAELPLDSEGEPLTPDKQIESTSATGPPVTYNYYSPTTISISTTIIRGSPNSGGADVGDVGGDGESGGGVGGEICDGDNCYGELPETIGECLEDFSACVGTAAAAGAESLIEGVPLLAFVSDLHASFSGVSGCPSVPLDFFEQEFDLFESLCPVLESNQSFISALALVMWSLAALNVLLRAQS